jgi:hypothetical protein
LLAGWSVDRMVCLFGWLVACLLASEYRWSICSWQLNIDTIRTAWIMSFCLMNSTVRIWGSTKMHRYLIALHTTTRPTLYAVCFRLVGNSLQIDFIHTMGVVSLMPKFRWRRLVNCKTVSSPPQCNVKLSF